MSKAILVIDMPTKCEDCPCYTDEMISKNWDICRGLNIRVDTEANKPNWCPLKPIPQKLAENFGNNTPTNTYIMNGTERQYLDMYAVGWNGCIDEILGEE